LIQREPTPSYGRAGENETGRYFTSADFGPPEAGKLKAKIGNSSSGTLELAEEQRRILAEVDRLCELFVQQGRERFWMLDSGKWMCEG